LDSFVYIVCFNNLLEPSFSGEVSFVLVVFVALICLLFFALYYPDFIHALAIFPISNKIYYKKLYIVSGFYSKKKPMNYFIVSRKK